MSARHTWTVYEINKHTGAVVWQLGGKHSSFKLGPGAHFEWQHDARLQPDGTITLFDNGTGPGPQHESQSRALRLRLNVKTHRATLVKAYTNDPSLLSGSQGDVQVLRDGNVFVGWGAVPYFTEFSAGGRQLFSVYFHGDMETYRAQRFNWWGQPTTPPAIAVDATRPGHPDLRKLERRYARCIMARARRPQPEPTEADRNFPEDELRDRDGGPQHPALLRGAGARGSRARAGRLGHRQTLVGFPSHGIQVATKAGLTRGHRALTAGVLRTMGHRRRGPKVPQPAASPLI